MSKATPPNHIITNASVDVAPGVTIDDHRRTLVGVVLDLFQGKPSLYKMDFFAEDAVYEDPVAKSVGRTSIAGQFYGLPELFRSSVTKSAQITASDAHTTSFRVLHEFTPKLVPKTVSFDTVMTITVDAAGKITHWRDRPSAGIPDGGSGLAEWLRTKQSELTKAVLSLPNDEEEDLERWRKWYGDAVPK
ncbi:hypothetical protein EVJ58_g1405 [Rhodofomes roseus]|uniref:SnoaL-like domain-containing protein n=1 Tax=Rhodofomes roseus TaxID=34475 RepID=A0A4Y9Z1I1_9APHY|nr:hypothetical protein EVJ58_g1405 [Rhodofomes roseus]